MSTFTNFKNTSFFKIAKKDDQTKLSFLEEKLKMLRDDSQSRTSAQVEHIRAYSAADSSNALGTIEQTIGLRPRGSIKKTRIPFIHDLTESKVSQMTRLKSDIRVLPRHPEYTDRGASKVAHLVVRNIMEQQRFDALMVDIHRMKYILGEIYLMVEWDDNLGDFDPIYLEAKKQGIDKIKLENGKTIDLKRPLMTGDVRLKIEYPWNVLVEKRVSGKYEDANYGFHIEYVNFDELESDYPKVSQYTNHASTDDVAQSLMRNIMAFDEDEVPVYHFYHKKTKYLPDGKYIKFIPGFILEETDLPYEHGDFPWERLTDIDVPNHQNGLSRYFLTLPIQKRYDDINLITDLNTYRSGQGKWLIFGQSVKPEDLGGAGQYAHWTGPVKPEYVQMAPSSPQVYQQLQSYREQMTSIFGSVGISKDTIPPGVTAFSAIQLVNQLESERASPEIQKHANFVVRACKKMLALAGQWYKSDDGRLARVIGKDNEYAIKYFDSANLSKPYDIKFENSDGFPETEAAKAQRIQETARQLPDIMSGAEWMHHLGLNDEEGAINNVTAAIRSAESENEDLMAGEEVMAPEEFEDHITHYKVHYNLFQKRQFKEEATNEIMLAAKEHLKMTEELMIAKAAVSPIFQSQLATLPMFPVFFHENYQPPMGQQQAQAVAQGQANRGEPLTAVIPETPNNSVEGQ